MTLISLAGIAAFTILVDPSAKFGSEILPPIVWTSRAQKIEILESQEIPPSALILGSSRAMKIEPFFVDSALRTRSFNAAVNSAMVEDYAAIYRYVVDDLHFPITTVILAVDAEAFHNNRPPDERLLATQKLAKHIPGVRPRDRFLKQAAAAISYQQLRLSAKSLIFGLTSYPTRTTTFDDRGFLTYVIWDRQLLDGTFSFENNFEASVPEYLGRFAHFSGLSSARQELLLTLLDRWKRDGVNVLIYLTPLHPRLISTLESETSFPQRTEELSTWLAKETAQRSIPFGDYTRLDGFPESDARFYDGAHPRVETNRVILSDLFEKADYHAFQ